VSKRKLEATRANQARKAAGGRRTPPGYTPKPGSGGSRSRLWIIVGVVVAIAASAGIAFALLAGNGGGSSSAAAGSVDWAKLEGLQQGPPPWTPGLDHLVSRLDALGISPGTDFSHNGLAEHIHQHVDVYVDGKKVTVPANIGIDVAQGQLSHIHTHDARGVFHVEAPSQRDFTLGEAFGVWGVRLTGDCLGSFCTSGSKHVKVFVNGKPVTGDPGMLLLRPHQEIVVAYGTAAQLPRPLPSKYAFQPGE
jgi:hypothetical protein